VGGHYRVSKRAAAQPLKLPQISLIPFILAQHIAYPAPILLPYEGAQSCWSSSCCQLPCSQGSVSQRNLSEINFVESILFNPFFNALLSHHLLHSFSAHPLSINDFEHFSEFVFLMVVSVLDKDEWLGSIILCIGSNVHEGALVELLHVGCTHKHKESVASHFIETLEACMNLRGIKAYSAVEFAQFECIFLHFDQFL